MKTLFILFFGVFLITGLLANPVQPRFISELYFDGDDWTIELFNYEYFPEDLTCQWIATATDTVNFNLGVEFFYEDILLITQDDLQEPLSINKFSDLVTICIGTLDGPYYDQIGYGNSQINSPYEGQSLARMMLNEHMYEEIFLLAKENQPSLGEDPFEVTSRGTLAGYVYDSVGNPVANAEIRYSPSNYQSEFYTDENGFFENDDMYGRNYEVRVFMNNHQFGYVNLTVEPDSTTVHDFYTTYVSTEPNELNYPEFSLSNCPNPYYLADDGCSSTKISFSIPAQFSENAKVTIYNLKGQKIKTIDSANSWQRSGDSFSALWDGTNEQGKQVHSGVYFYVLELEGREVATSKMIILK